MGISHLWIKNEGQNPTGSHKDRMSPLIVARTANLKRFPVLAASSGNAGASLAAFAAAADVPCKIIVTPKINEAWERAIRITGAEVIVAPNSSERWKMVRKMELIQLPIFTNAPVGSNLYGVQGYKTVGYEIIEQMQNNMPTAIVVPCARGDLLWGIWEGLVEARDLGWIEYLPKLYAVEPFPRLTKVLEGQDYRETFTGDSSLTPSIGGDTVTYQTVSVVQSSKGAAVVFTGEEAVHAQTEMAQKGFYVEGSSAVTWAATSKLIQKGLIVEEDRTLLIVTSHGYKDC